MGIKLKKDGWHYNIQNFVMDYSYYRKPMKNFCPYFWLTIFCILVSPFVGLYKTLVKSWKFIKKRGENTFSWFNKNLCDPLFDKMMIGVDDEQVYIWYLEYQDWPYGNDEFKKWQMALQRSGQDFEKMLKMILMRKAEIKEEIQRKKEVKFQTRKDREEKRRKMALFFANLTKKIFPGIAVILLSLTGYGLYNLGLYVAELAGMWTLDWILINNVLSFIGFLLGVAAIIFVLVILGKLIFKCNLPRIPGGKIVGGFFGKITNGISSFFEFIGEYISAIKENHCPHIEWEKEES